MKFCRVPVTGEYHPWTGMNPDYDDTSWDRVEETRVGTPLLESDDYGATTTYTLTRRTIPLMAERPQRFGSVRYSR